MLAFLDKYLKGENVSTQPGLQYLDQTGTWRSAPSYPVPSTGEVSVNASGTLDLNPDDESGYYIEGSLGFNAVDFKISPPSTSVETLGDPELTLTYKGTASTPTAPIFAQLVDNSPAPVIQNPVVDGQVTPIDLTLDGKSHTITVPLNMVVWNLTPSSSIELDLEGASNVYIEHPPTGEVQLDAHLVWPTSVPGPPS